MHGIACSRPAIFAPNASILQGKEIRPHRSVSRPESWASPSMWKSYKNPNRRQERQRGNRRETPPLMMPPPGGILSIYALLSWRPSKVYQLSWPLARENNNGDLSSIPGCATWAPLTNAWGPPHDNDKYLGTPGHGPSHTQYQHSHNYSWLVQSLSLLSFYHTTSGTPRSSACDDI
jgi:hypothetical protein